MTNGDRRLASISLDLDDLWTYLKVRDEPGWETFPSYLETLIPLVIEAFAALELGITVFVVGSDATRAGELIQKLTDAGHEIGNHSFRHDTWMHSYSRTELAEDIARADDAIAAATGKHPIGFRGPGFAWHPDLTDVLSARGYLYDSSILPTFVGPLAEWYYLRSMPGGVHARVEQRGMYGRFRDGFRPNAPHRMQTADGGKLLELPVTTLPGFRTPIHMTYLLWLAGRSEKLMLAYLRSAIVACRMAGIAPNVVFHPTDLMGGELVPRLAFFPTMDLTTERKRALLGRVVGELSSHFTLVPLAVRAAEIA